MLAGKRRSSQLETTTEDAAAAIAPSVRPCLIKDSLDEISGVNRNLCSLAQSYFQQQKPPGAVNRKTSLGSGPEPASLQPSLARNASFKSDQRRMVGGDVPVQPQNLALKLEDEKASIVAAFFQGARPPPAAKVSLFFGYN
jgi:hypothetical protein